MTENNKKCKHLNYEFNSLTFQCKCLDCKKVGTAGWHFSGVYWGQTYFHFWWMEENARRLEVAEKHGVPFVRVSLPYELPCH